MTTASSHAGTPPHFLAKYDITGRRVWAIEVEYIPVSGFYDWGTGQIVLLPNGNVLWLEYLQSGTLGATAAGLHFVEVSPDGDIVGTRPLSYAANPATLTTGRVRRLSALADGRLALLIHRWREPNPNSVDVVLLDASGVVETHAELRTLFFNIPVWRPQAAGVGLGVSVPWGCWMDAFDPGLVRAPLISLCTVGSAIGEVHEDDAGWWLVHYTSSDAAGATSERTALYRGDIMDAQYDVAAPAGNVFHDLYVDARLRASVLERTPSGDLVTRVLSPFGAPEYQFTIPASEASSMQNPFLFGAEGGTLYLAATKTYGVGLPEDVILLRNPQLRYEP